MEPIVATMLAAGAAGACAVVGVALAASRGSPHGRVAAPTSTVATCGLVRPRSSRRSLRGPKLVTIPLTVLLVILASTARRDARGGSAASSDGRTKTPSCSTSSPLGPPQDCPPWPDCSGR